MPVFVQSVGGAGVREVGEIQHRGGDLGVQGADGFLQGADLAADGAHFGDDFVGRGLALGAGLSDGAGDLVAAGAEFVALGDSGAAAGVQGEDGVQAVFHPRRGASGRRGRRWVRCGFVQWKA